MGPQIAQLIRGRARLLSAWLAPHRGNLRVAASYRVTPAERVQGHVAVPGDKSISHRALFVAAMAEGSSRITGLSPAADVRSTLEMITMLGVATHPRPGERAQGESQVELEADASPPSIQPSDLQILVESPGRSRWSRPARPIDVGNSGSTIRIGLGVLAPSSVQASLTGDESIARRPMRRVVEPLRRMGAQIDGIDGGDRIPVTVRGAPLQGITYESPVASAQVKSALLLAGLGADGVTRVSEPSRSRDHTERMLGYMKVPIDMSTNSCSVEGTDLRSVDIDVPGDLSSAAFLLVAAAILPGSSVTIRGVGLNPTRTGVLDVLRSFGADVRVEGERELCGEPRGDVTISAASRRAFDLGGTDAVRAIDELPLAAVLGAFAESGTTTVRDAGELRIKESDRIDAVVAGLTAMGADIEARPDGFAVRGGGQLRGSRIDPRGDHRIAMALAVAALGAEGETLIDGWGCVDVSYPGFDADLESLVVR